MASEKVSIGRILKHQRITVPLTLQQLSAASGVSASYLGRVESGQRFPSARVLRKVAKPLGFHEDELFTLAGYLSPHPSGIAEDTAEYAERRLDPYVARVLSQEPLNVQRADIAILTVMKTLGACSTNGGSESRLREADARG